MTSTLNLLGVSLMKMNLFCLSIFTPGAGNFMKLKLLKMVDIVTLKLTSKSLKTLIWKPANLVISITIMITEHLVSAGTLRPTGQQVNIFMQGEYSVEISVQNHRKEAVEVEKVGVHIGNNQVEDCGQINQIGRMIPYL